MLVPKRQNFKFSYFNFFIHLIFIFCFSFISNTNNFNFKKIFLIVLVVKNNGHDQLYNVVVIIKNICPQNAVIDQPGSSIPTAVLLAFTLTEKYCGKVISWHWMIICQKDIFVECRRQDSYFCSFTHWFTLVTTSSLSLWSRELSLRASPKHCRRTSASHTAALYFWLTESICEQRKRQMNTAE